MRRWSMPCVLPGVECHRLSLEALAEPDGAAISSSALNSQATAEQIAVREAATCNHPLALPMGCEIVPTLSSSSSVHGSIGSWTASTLKAASTKDRISCLDASR